jgi:hypothetical protein
MSEVKLGGDHAGFAGQGPGHQPSARSNDRRIAPRQPVILVAVQRVGVREVARHVGAAQEGGHADDEHLPLLGDVAQGGHPLVTVPRRRQEHVDPALVHRHPSERHVVLPADERADPGAADVDDRQKMVVALTAHEPLGADGTSLRCRSATLHRCCTIEEHRRRLYCGHGQGCAATVGGLRSGLWLGVDE